MSFEINHGHEMWAPADYAPSWKEDFAALFIYTHGYPKMDTQKVRVFDPEELRAFAQEVWEAARGKDYFMLLDGNTTRLNGWPTFDEYWDVRK